MMINAEVHLRSTEKGHISQEKRIMEWECQRNDAHALTAAKLQYRLLIICCRFPLICGTGGSLRNKTHRG